MCVICITVIILRGRKTAVIKNGPRTEDEKGKHKHNQVKWMFFPDKIDTESTESTPFFHPKQTLSAWLDFFCSFLNCIVCRLWQPVLLLCGSSCSPGKKKNALACCWCILYVCLCSASECVHAEWPLVISCWVVTVGQPTAAVNSTFCVANSLLCEKKPFIKLKLTKVKVFTCPANRTDLAFKSHWQRCFALPAFKNATHKSYKNV